MRRASRGVLGAVLALLIFAFQVAPAAPVAAQVPDDIPLRVRWTWSGPVTFCADTSLLPSGVSAATFRAWVQEAMDAWNVTQADVELRLSAETCVREANNGRNEVGFEVYGAMVAEVGRAYSSTLGDEPVEGDVTLRHDWETPAHCRVSALVHEFGHVLGFTHSEFESDVMGYGPCAVLQPSAQEVALLAASYGTRASSLALATAAPTADSVLALRAGPVPYEAQPGAYYFNAYVGLTGSTARALRAVECFTAAAATDPECTVESTLPNGFWPASSRQDPLGEVAQAFGQTVVVPASQFGHFARQVRACNAVGCAAPIDLRAGDVRANGTGVDFGYLVYPLPDGRVSVQIANLSFYAPPTFQDVPSTFEVRRPDVTGAAGLLGSCVLSLGQTCEMAGDYAGQALDIVVFVASNSARTGVRVSPVSAVASGGGSTGGTTPISGNLPSSGFSLALWDGGSVTLAANDPRIGAIFVSQGGVLRGYVVGAPAFVNATFLSVVGEVIPAGTPVVVVVRQGV